MEHTESIQIHLSSKFATTYNNQNYSDCDFNTNLLQISDKHTILLSVVNAVVPYSFYNLNSTNNVLFYQELTSPVTNTTFYMSYGNYNANQLATYLSQNLPNTTVSYNSVTNKFTFVNSVNDFKILSQYTTCQNLLGLSTNDLYNTSIGKSLTLFKQINLATTQIIQIATNFQSGSLNNLNNNDMKILCSFPCTNSPYSLITYTNNDNYKVNLNTNIFNSINIKLLNQDGLPLELNQQYFSLTLQLDIVNFVDY